MFPLKVRIGSSLGLGDGGSSVLRNNRNGMAGKVLIFSRQLASRVFNCTFVLCSFLYSFS